MAKFRKMGSLAVAMALMLTSMFAVGALADDATIERYDHNGHLHMVYDGVDNTLVTLTGGAKVYASPSTDADAVTLSAGDEVCVIMRYSNGWAHVYYSDGEKAGWMDAGAL